MENGKSEVMVAAGKKAAAVRLHREKAIRQHYARCMADRDKLIQIGNMISGLQITKFGDPEKLAMITKFQTLANMLTAGIEAIDRDDEKEVNKLLDEAEGHYPNTDGL